MLPEVGGFRQPLSAAYRTTLLPLVNDLIATNRMRPAFLFERSQVRRLTEADLLKNQALARLDPQLESVSNLNEPADYERAHALPAPAIVVERFGPLARPGAPRRQTVSAWSLGATASASKSRSTSTSWPPSTAIRSRATRATARQWRYRRVHGRRRRRLASWECHPAASGRRCS